MQRQLAVSDHKPVADYRSSKSSLAPKHYWRRVPATKPEAIRRR
jgi:hypothetical protein